MNAPRKRKKSASRSGRRTASARARTRKPKASAPRSRALAAAAPSVAAESSLPDWDRELSDRTVPALGQCAADPLQRHQALDHAIVNVWATEDIGLVRRVESEGRCLWVMWRRSSVPPG